MIIAVMKLKDADQLAPWFAKADRILREELDAGYEVQFRNALPVHYARNGMAMAGLGYWQHLTGELAVLNAFIIDLRR
jgi:hypothetical protein